MRLEDKIINWLMNDETKRQENRNVKGTDIVGILEDAGYAPVIGIENVQRMIRNAADDSTDQRCSGWSVFPDGTRCDGCGDCQPNANLTGKQKPEKEVDYV